MASTAAVVRAFAQRDLHLARSYALLLGLDGLLGVVDLLIFLFISLLVDDGARQLGNAPTYFGFAAVGVAMTTVMHSASVEVARRVREEQLTGSLEILVVQPLTPAQLASGLVAFPFFFATLRGVAYVVIALLIGGLRLAPIDVLEATIVMMATSLALCGVGVALSGLVLVLKRGETLGSLVMVGLGLLGGAFFPIAVLPAWLRAVGNLSPTSFAFEGVRDALFGGEWLPDAVALLLISLITIPTGIWLLSRSLRVVARRGTLGQF